MAEKDKRGMRAFIWEGHGEHGFVLTHEEAEDLCSAWGTSHPH